MRGTGRGKTGHVSLALSQTVTTRSMGSFVTAEDVYKRQKVTTAKLRTMALTRDFKKTVVARVERDPAFAKALLDEAATQFLSGEPVTARLILRDLVNATLGFERLAKATATPSKSLLRML